MPAITACILSSLIGIYVFYKNPKNIQNRVFVLFILFVVAFSIGEAMLRLSSNSEAGLLWGRIAYLGTIFIPITFLHLSFVFPRKKGTSRTEKYVLFGLYLIGIIILSIFNWIISIQNVRLGIWGYRLSLDSSTSFVGIWAAILLAFAIFNLLRKYRLSKEIIERKQIRYVFYGALVAMLLAIPTGIILPIVDVKILPMSVIAISVFSFFVGAAILKHSLFIYRPLTETIIKPEKMALLNRDELEKEVQARTTALLKANEELNSEIIEHKKAEKEIKKSLKDKEMLLKEVHHRVKNNLQIISSLLYLQSKKIKDKKINDVTLEIHNRIRSMSLIHEKLYQSKNLSEIDFNDYIQKLTNNLLYSYGINEDDIKLNINANNVALGSDAAVSCGLIINELVSNSLKHAFPNNQKGEIHMDFHSDDEKIVLIIGDNGIGLPNDLDIQKTESLGLSLVKNLVDQLNGKLECRNNNGAEFKITFTGSKNEVEES